MERGGPMGIQRNLRALRRIRVGVLLMTILLKPVGAGASCCICQFCENNNACFTQFMDLPSCAAACFPCSATFGALATCGEGPIVGDCISTDGVPVPSHTPTATPTNTPTNTPSNTPTAKPTNTATATNTPTATPTNTGIPQGGACATPSVCASGFCANGVCCNTACNPDFGRCDLPGQRGTCAGVSPAPTLTPRAFAVAAILLIGVAAFALRRRVVRR